MTASPKLSGKIGCLFMVEQIIGASAGKAIKATKDSSPGSPRSAQAESML